MKTMCELRRFRRVRLIGVTLHPPSLEKANLEIEIASKHCENNMSQSDVSKRGSPTEKWHKKL